MCVVLNSVFYLLCWCGMKNNVKGSISNLPFFFFAYVLLPIVLCSVFKRIVYSYLTEQHCASFMLKKFPVKVTEGESFTSRSGDTSVAKPLFC